MKRKILSGLMGVAMLGAAASANAFIFDLANGDLNGAGMTVTGLPVGAAPVNGAFNVALDLSTIFGNSSIFTDLAGMTAGSSRSASALMVDGDIVIYNPAVTPNNITRTYNDRTAFTGSVTTTLNSLVGFASLPGTVNTTTGNFSGVMTVDYNGTFDNFPLLGLGGPGSGQLVINFGFTNATDVLAMIIAETVNTGTGFEAALNSLDDSFGVDSGTLGAAVWAGQTVVSNGPTAQIPYTSTDNFRVSAVPEPASLALLGLGLAGLGFMRRRKA